jgi:hypothetical protein
MENDAPCTFAFYVKQVYQMLSGSGDPPYDDLPERERRAWRLLAHAMVKVNDASAD